MDIEEFIKENTMECRDIQDECYGEAIPSELVRAFFSKAQGTLSVESVRNFIINADEKTLSDIGFTVPNAPAGEVELDEDALGLVLYQELRGCGMELAKEEWTAKHFKSECKNKASWLTKALALRAKEIVKRKE